MSEEVQAAAWPPRKVVCVGTVVCDGERILLVRQAAGTSLAGKWSIPWGVVEAEEAPEAAALRETWEEARVKAEIEGLLGYQNFAWESSVAFVYLCRHVAGEPAGDGAETDRAAYFSAADLDALAESVEAWCAWIVRRVLAGNYRLLPAEPDNPSRPLLAFF